MSYEKLVMEVEDEGIELFENNYIGKLKGLYVDNTITLNTNITTEIEKKCILAEELGHYHTSSGDIRDQSKIENRKQELKARRWAVQKLIAIENFKDAFDAGIRNRYELSEFLGVSESFIEISLNHFKGIYGLYVQIDNYIVYFEPLSVVEMWE